jgi:hypothetical protein
MHVPPPAPVPQVIVPPCSSTIVQSLDKLFGLDEEAIKAAKQWKFMPGCRFGEPVPVLVKIELQFTLR